MKKRLFGILSAAVIAAASVPVQGASGWDTLNESEKGGLLCREYIEDETQGTHQFTPDYRGEFSAEWDGVKNYAAEMCTIFSREANWDLYDYIQQRYDATAEIKGNVFFGLHGWTKNDLAEYFVVEGWGSWRPPGGVGQTGTVAVNGQRYDCYSYERVNQPSIEGTKTYRQLWSVRQSSALRDNTTNRISGTIYLEQHFQGWARLGMIEGTLCPESCGLYIDAYGGFPGDTSGSLKVSRNELTYSVKIVPHTETTTTTTTTTAQPVKKQAADKNGVFFRSDFETGLDGWTPRKFADKRWEDSSLLVSDDLYYAENGHSLYVSNRSEPWEGASRSLDGYALEPGKEYKVQAAVMQDSESTETMRLILTYTDSNGEDQYETIEKQTCKKDEWNVLSGTFRMPEASEASSGDPHETVSEPYNFSIYAETESEPCDYWLDCVTLSEKDADVQIDLSKAVPAPKPAETKLVQYPARDGSEPYRAHQNKNYSYIGGGTGFKDVLGPYFRVGATVSTYALNDERIRDFYLKNFNSITCENEMKPDQIVKSINGSEVTVNLGAADNILKFAEENNIGVRGHCFVWHSQTPGGMYQGTPEESDARIENLIKQTFEQLKTNYPDLDLYAYDVCNEVFKNNGGGLRVKDGSGNDISQWAKIYGDDNPEFIINAFKLARQYAPENCKLYLNEYNEYMPDKCDDLCGLAKQIMKEGDYIDGIGMQSHLGISYPDKSIYESALKKFASLGLDVQITELEIADYKGENAAKAAQLWKDVYTVALTYADNISSVTIWEPIEGNWRWQRSSTLFRSDTEPYPVYYDILDLTDEIAPPVATEVPIAKPERPGTSETSGNAPSGDLCGDVNCDDSVDVADVVLLLRYAVSDEDAKITDQGVLNGDADGNGKTDTDDASLILRFIAKKIQL